MSNRKKVNRFKAGGRHNQNPIGGIPFMRGALAEEGEASVRFKDGDYIFSDRLFINDIDFLLPIKLPRGLTFAEAADHIEKTYGEGGSKIEADSKLEALSALRVGQTRMHERDNIQTPTNQFADGTTEPVKSDIGMETADAVNMLGADAATNTSMEKIEALQKKKAGISGTSAAMGIAGGILGATPVGWGLLAASALTSGIGNAVVDKKIKSEKSNIASNQSAGMNNVSLFKDQKKAELDSKPTFAPLDDNAEPLTSAAPLDLKPKDKVFFTGTAGAISTGTAGVTAVKTGMGAASKAQIISASIEGVATVGSAAIALAGANKEAQARERQDAIAAYGGKVSMYGPGTADALKPRFGKNASSTVLPTEQVTTQVDQGISPSDFARIDAEDTKREFARIQAENDFMFRDQMDTDKELAAIAKSKIGDKHPGYGPVLTDKQNRQVDRRIARNKGGGFGSELSKGEKVGLGVQLGTSMLSSTIGMILNKKADKVVRPTVEQDRAPKPLKLDETIRDINRREATTREALAQRSGGDFGQFAQAATNLHNASANAVGQTYAKQQQLNQQDLQFTDSFNQRGEQINARYQVITDNINAQNEAAYQDQNLAYTDAMFANVGSVGQSVTNIGQGDRELEAYRQLAKSNVLKPK